jgi:hypothetical protein
VVKALNKLIVKENLKNEAALGGGKIVQNPGKIGKVVRAPAPTFQSATHE